MNSLRRSWAAYAKVTFAVVAWGASFIATKVALQEVSPATVVWLRFGIGVLILGLAALWRERRHPMIVLVAVACVAKILAEMTLGEALLTQTAWSSVPAAHMGGLLSGGMFLLSRRHLPR